MPNPLAKADDGRGIQQGDALLTSAMHMAWLRCVSGRLKSDYRYSIGLVYNTFPVPPEGANLSSLEPLAQAVLDARAAHPNATLADLYDPVMPPNLRKAKPSTERWTASTVPVVSTQNGTAWSTCSCCTNR